MLSKKSADRADKNGDCRARTLQKGEADTALPAAGNGEKLEEALAALVMLGFAKTAAEKALRGILRENPGASVEDLVRMGLKSL